MVVTQVDPAEELPVQETAEYTSSKVTWNAPDAGVAVGAGVGLGATSLVGVAPPPD
jgi:hypothetical protein